MLEKLLVENVWKNQIFWFLGNIQKIICAKIAENQVRLKVSLEANQILKKCQDILVERGVQRDQPNGERSAEDIIKCFNTMRKKDLLASDFWLIMELCKQVRSCRGEFDPDHYVDGANYCALRGEEKFKESNHEKHP